MNYNEFLHSKVQVAPVSGFDVRPEDVHSVLKPHQRDAVIWACKGGRRALFESFGLGSQRIKEMAQTACGGGDTMKAVLISIKPKWCELIASGKKDG